MLDPISISSSRDHYSGLLLIICSFNIYAAHYLLAHLYVWILLLMRCHFVFIYVQNETVQALQKQLDAENADHAACELLCVFVIMLCVDDRFPI